MNAIATVAALFVYPLKSAHAIARSEVRVRPTGFEWDRHWMLINAQGVFLSQRTHPQLACIVPRIEGEELLLQAPGLAHLRLPRTCRGERLPARVHNDRCIGLDEGSAAAE